MFRAQDLGPMPKEGERFLLQGQTQEKGTGTFLLHLVTSNVNISLIKVPPYDPLCNLFIFAYFCFSG